jgi:hypothetical protein
MLNMTSIMSPANGTAHYGIWAAHRRRNAVSPALRYQIFPYDTDVLSLAKSAGAKVSKVLTVYRPVRCPPPLCNSTPIHSINTLSIFSFFFTPL